MVSCDSFKKPTFDTKMMYTCFYKTSILETPLNLSSHKGKHYSLKIKI